MLKGTYLLAAMLMFCFANAKAMAVDTIADVKTLADLRAQPVIHFENGWDVQIGLRDPDADAGPYKLIYCLAKSAKTDFSEETRGEYSLGPVSVDLVEGNAVELDKIQSVRQSKGDGEKLYCQILPIGWTDNILIRVHDEAKVLLEKKLGKSDHRPFYWMPFAKRHRDGSDRQTVVLSTWQTAQCPSLDGLSSILQTWPAKHADAPQIPPFDAPLPGDGTLSPEWRKFLLPSATSDDVLQIKIENEKFVIHAATRCLNSPDEWHLLARWWVNDTPISAKPADPKEQEAFSFSGHVNLTDTLCVELGLPAFLGQLKVGDRVGLQVMYASSFEPIGTERMSRLIHPSGDGINVLLMANRLDFTIDEHLLSLVVK